MGRSSGYPGNDWTGGGPLWAYGAAAGGQILRAVSQQLTAADIGRARARRAEN